MKRITNNWLVLPFVLGALVLSGCKGEVSGGIEETRHPDGTKTITISGTVTIKWDASESIAELVVQDGIDDWNENLRYISVGSSTINAYGATVPFSGSGPSHELKSEIELLQYSAQDNGFSIDTTYTYTDLMIHNAEQ